MHCVKKSVMLTLSWMLFTNIFYVDYDIIIVMIMMLMVMMIMMMMIMMTLMTIYFCTFGTVLIPSYGTYVCKHLR